MISCRQDSEKNNCQENMYISDFMKSGKLEQQTFYSYVYWIIKTVLDLFIAVSMSYYKL